MNNEERDNRVLTDEPGASADTANSVKAHEGGLPSPAAGTPTEEPVPEPAPKSSPEFPHDGGKKPNPEPPGEEKKKRGNGKSGKGKIVKRTLLVIVLLLGIYLVYSALSVFVSPDRNVQQIYLVPKDAAFIIHSGEPVADWQRFSGSPQWQAMKKTSNFADIAASAEMMDSIVHNNKTLLSLIGKRDLMISVHKTGTTAWDFLIVLDLQKISKLNLLKDQIETVGKLAGFQVTHRRYKDIGITEMRDPATRNILYTAFVENHFVASYSSSLVTAAIDERENPGIGLNAGFIEAEKLVAGKGLCRVYINYEWLPGFMSIYLAESNPWLDLFSESMDFAGMWLNTDKEKMEVKGYTLLGEEPDPYVSALLNSGRTRMKAHEIMSARTAFYANVGFGNTETFVSELERALSAHDPASFDSYTNTRKRLENYFDISLSENFLSWMAGEFAISQLEPGLLGREAETVLAIRAKNIKEAKNQMEYIEKKIRRRTPIKIKAVDYNGFEINYIEMKGFFKLFFGGLFDKFEKPYYTYIGDYVVLSNQSSALLSFIEDYRQGNLLADDPGFKKSLGQADINSNIFGYADTHRFFPLLQAMVNSKTAGQLQSDRDIVYSFPQINFQVSSDKRQAAMQFVMNYAPYEPDAEVTATAPAIVMTDDDADLADTAMDEDADSDRELMSELKRFHVEKFEGNVLREFYEGGELKSESEVRDGVRHGRYREFYPSGELSLRGKYVKGRPRGTWKYYTPEGKFDRKEKF